jgi:hypothetical protein
LVLILLLLERKKKEDFERKWLESKRNEMERGWGRFAGGRGQGLAHNWQQKNGK